MCTYEYIDDEKWMMKKKEKLSLNFTIISYKIVDNFHSAELRLSIVSFY